MNSLTIFRIADGLTDPDKILIGRQKLAYSPVMLDGKRIGDMYVRRSDRREPPWLAYFGKSVEIPISTRTSSLAAVVLVKEGDALFAIVFGFGKSLLAEGVIENRFGLKATLNAVEPSQLRSIDHKRLDAISRHTREQLSREGPLEQFGLDIDRDLLRAVTGTPVDSTYGRRLSGSDQLTVSGNLPLKALKENLAKYDVLAAKRTYVENFPWVDNVRDIRNPVLIRKLDAQLLEDLKIGNANCWLAPPEVIDWASTTGFAYNTRKTATVQTDMGLSDLFDEYGLPESLTVESLTHARIYHIRSEETTGQHSWSALKCMVADCLHDGRRYVLNEGIWYEIEPNFLESVEAFVRDIPKGTISFSTYVGGPEGTYNKRASRKSAGLLALLDQNFIVYPRRGKVEVCDLFSSSKVFVHVKRIGASSTLSHLFAQGTVSAQLMVQEPGFRKQFYSKIPASHQWGNPDDEIRPSDFEVCFAVIPKPGKTLSLPFFSKVSLRSAVRNLRQLGYKVSLAEIPCSSSL
jgi:uncharacterized protein (TIGR04141 family)